MNARLKAQHYADRIKDVLIEMEQKNGVPLEMKHLDTKKIRKVLYPVFEILNSLQIDAEMAIDGSWDVEGDKGKLGFESQIRFIKSL